jgi:wyosine [tRNA(Phe)-imidazoG37] synthetase (radical SAM superfamily)
VFGPVPSRRLGKSLGINNIPAKNCPYSCVYCQVGQVARSRIERRAFFSPADILQEVRDRLDQAGEAGQPIDYLTFVPDGEPTLDINLGRTIDLLQSLSIPVAVITNSSLLWREEVREELGRADWVSLKIDTVTEDIWRRINRPHQAINLPQIIEGIRAFARTFTGTLVTETMLVRGVNDQEASMAGVVGLLQKVQPQRAYLSIPTRPPAVAGVSSPDETTLNRMYQIMADHVKAVEYLIGYEGNDFASTGDIEQDLLSITAVHPLRQEAVNALLARTGSSPVIVARMVAQGDIAQVRHNGHLFYLRKYSQDRPLDQKQPLDPAPIGATGEKDPHGTH